MIASACRFQIWTKNGQKSDIVVYAAPTAPHRDRGSEARVSPFPGDKTNDDARSRFVSEQHANVPVRVRLLPRRWLGTSIQPAVRHAPCQLRCTSHAHMLVLTPTHSHIDKRRNREEMQEGREKRRTRKIRINTKRGARQ